MHRGKPAAPPPPRGQTHFGNGLFPTVLAADGGDQDRAISGRDVKEGNRFRLDSVGSSIPASVRSAYYRNKEAIGGRIFFPLCIELAHGFGNHWRYGCVVFLLGTTFGHYSALSNQDFRQFSGTASASKENNDRSKES